jgi:hypothetical protein
METIEEYKDRVLKEIAHAKELCLTNSKKSGASWKEYWRGGINICKVLETRIKIGGEL